MSYPSRLSKPRLFIHLCRNRYKIWVISGIAVLISLAGLITSWLDPSIGYPLRPGLDFTGGTQIKIERKCQDHCEKVSSFEVSSSLKMLSFSQEGNKTNDINLSVSRIQSLDSSKTLLIRLPFLSASQAQDVIKNLEPIVGPFELGTQSIDTIGPSLGSQLLRSSLVSLLAAFLCIAIYISYRFDRRFSFLAIIALVHDLIIVCGVFSWLGLVNNLEINSLFAVALLTISGYSVNDTVVVFDRIRELNNSEEKLTLNQRIDIAVSATLSRTLYTSGTTLLPLAALIFFGGSTLYWFAIALALGVIVGSWSSIALAPSLLSLRKDN